MVQVARWWGVTPAEWEALPVRERGRRIAIFNAEHEPDAPAPDAPARASGSWRKGG